MTVNGGIPQSVHMDNVELLFLSLFCFICQILELVCPHSPSSIKYQSLLARSDTKRRETKINRIKVRYFFKQKKKLRKEKSESKRILTGAHQANNESMKITAFSDTKKRMLTNNLHSLNVLISYHGLSPFHVAFVSLTSLPEQILPPFSQ